MPPQSSGIRSTSESCFFTRSVLALALSILFKATTIGTRAAPVEKNRRPERRRRRTGTGGHRRLATRCTRSCARTPPSRGAGVAFCRSEAVVRCSPSCSRTRAHLQRHSATSFFRGPRSMSCHAVVHTAPLVRSGLAPSLSPKRLGSEVLQSLLAIQCGVTHGLEDLRFRQRRHVPSSARR